MLNWGQATGNQPGNATVWRVAMAILQNSVDRHLARVSRHKWPESRANARSSVATLALGSGYRVSCIAGSSIRTRYRQKFLGLRLPEFSA